MCYRESTRRCCERRWQVIRRRGESSDTARHTGNNRFMQTAAVAREYSGDMSGWVSFAVAQPRKNEWRGCRSLTATECYCGSPSRTRHVNNHIEKSGEMSVAHRENVTRYTPRHGVTLRSAMLPALLNGSFDASYTRDGRIRAASPCHTQRGGVTRRCHRIRRLCHMVEIMDKW